MASRKTVIFLSLFRAPHASNLSSIIGIIRSLISKFNMFSNTCDIQLQISVVKCSTRMNLIK